LPNLKVGLRSNRESPRIGKKNQNNATAPKIARTKS